MTTVELRRALIWDCDNCGRENLVRLMPISPDDEDREEIEAEGLDPDTAVMVPSEVECPHCKTKFDTEVL